MLHKTVSVFAPAKINLALHVTGRREDGYHLLDTLVAFAQVGDRLTLERGDGLSLIVEGPEAGGVPAGMDNLALRAAAVLASGQGAAVTLAKHLPAASGIGGGSSDAAAALRGMLALWQGWDDRQRPDFEQAFAPFAHEILALGADLPMCLLARPCRARGIGHQLDFVALPRVPALLVNPRVQVATAQVFETLAQRNNAPMPDLLPEFADAATLIGWLHGQRNDLEPPAISVAPVIADVLSALDACRDCGLARMSGSGATCFGLFLTAEAAATAAKRIASDHPDWWVAKTWIGDLSLAAIPQVS